MRFLPLSLLPGLLAACTAPVSQPVPLAASGPVELTLEGQSYIADLQPLAAGVVELSVIRGEGQFAYDQGKEAKSVAEAFCSGRGMALDPAAMGGFAAGAWVFDGGCV